MDGIIQLFRASAATQEEVVFSVLPPPTGRPHCTVQRPLQLSARLIDICIRANLKIYTDKAERSLTLLATSCSIQLQFLKIAVPDAEHAQQIPTTPSAPQILAFS